LRHRCVDRLRRGYRRWLRRGRVHRLRRCYCRWLRRGRVHRLGRCDNRRCGRIDRLLGYDLRRRLRRRHHGLLDLGCGLAAAA
jgi:hypothetical protein